MSWGVPYPLCFNELRGCLLVVMVVYGCFVVCCVVLWLDDSKKNGWEWFGF